MFIKPLQRKIINEKSKKKSNKVQLTINNIIIKQIQIQVQVLELGKVIKRKKKLKIIRNKTNNKVYIVYCTRENL